MMTLRLDVRFLFLPLILCTSAALAQVNSVFLRIQGESHSVWVLGVLNLNDPRLMSFSDGVFDALGQSRSVNVLTPVCDESLLETGFPYLGKGSLETMYDNANFLALDQVCRTYLQQSAWHHMDIQPLALRGLIEHRMAHNSGEATADEQLSFIAREQGTPVTRGLAPSLCSAMETIPVALQVDMLVTLVNRLVPDSDYTAALTKLYLDGQLDLLSRLASSSEHLEYQVQLREEWIQSIMELIVSAASDSAFLIVDATLLGGPGGVLEKVESAGLRVESLVSGLSYSGAVLRNNRWLSMAIPPDHNNEVIEYYDIGNTYTENDLDSLLPRWYSLVSHAGGFTGRMPQRPAFSMERRPASGEYLTVHLFKCEDLAVNSFHAISYSNYPTDFSTSDGAQEFFDQIVDSAVSTISGVLLSNVNISTPPVRAREIEIEVQEDFIVRSRFYLVDNRFYQVMVGTSKRSAYSAKDNAFLGSLRIMNQKNTPWHTVNLGMVKAELPGHPQREVKALQSGLFSFNYSAKDEHTGLEYMISYTPFAPGSTSKSDAELYNGMVRATVSSLNGTMLSDGAFYLGDQVGREVEIAVRENTYCRVRFFVKDNRLVQLILSGEGDSIYSTFAERFMDSLVLNPAGS